MTKVGKSYGEGTFPGTRGNDKVAPIPDLPALTPAPSITKAGARTETVSPPRLVEHAATGSIWA
jgi:hypothetical protein